MKNTFMTPVHSKVLHTGRHPLVEDVVSQSGLYSLAYFFLPLLAIQICYGPKFL